VPPDRPSGAVQAVQTAYPAVQADPDSLSGGPGGPDGPDGPGSLRPARRESSRPMPGPAVSDSPAYRLVQSGHAA